MMMKKPNYNRAERNDTAIISCFYSASEYKTPYRNALKFIRSIREVNYPLFFAELLYEDQKSKIPNPYLILKSDSVMFHCNNLFNIVAKKIPEQYTKFIFCDSDILFSDPNWYDKASELLNQYDIIQPMELVDKITTKGHSFAYEVKSTKRWSRKGYKGLAVAMTRKYYNDIGGLYDRGYLGANDALNWMIGLRSKPKLLDNFTNQIKQDISNKIETLNMKTLLPSVGYIDGCTVYHMFHGLPKNRNYGRRYKDYKITNNNIYYNDSGVLEWEDKTNNSIMSDYFKQRREDGGLGSLLYKALYRYNKKNKRRINSKTTLEYLSLLDRQDSKKIKLKYRQLLLNILTSIKNQNLTQVNIRLKCLQKFVIQDKYTRLQ